MSKPFREPIRPHWRVLFIVLAGILVETAGAIAGARPLKTILDNVVGSHHLPMLLTHSVGPLPGGTSKVLVAAFAAMLLVAIAVAGAIAHRLSTTGRTGRVIEINGGVVAQKTAELDKARYETKAALAA